MQGTLRVFVCTYVGLYRLMNGLPTIIHMLLLIKVYLKFEGMK